MADFVMPALGADMEAGTVVEWRVRAGQRVRPGDVVAVVETHKGAIDVECFLDGVIDSLVPLGTALPVGAVLAQVRSPGEVAEPAPTAPPSAAAAATPPLAAARAATRSRVSPAARRRAAELGMLPDALRGSGADGAVVLADIERWHAASQAAAPPPSEMHPRIGPARFDPGEMRQAIAAAMTRSKREIPHYYLQSTIDLRAALAWLDTTNASRDAPQRLLPAALLLKATARALVQVPQLNGFWRDGGFVPGVGIHLGWAIALRGGGLVAPAVHDADRLSLDEVMAALRDLVQRARTGGLRSSEIGDPTVTVTSLGERGAESVLGVIVPPQVAIVGFGRVVERPWVVNDAVVARPLVALTLAGDHRVSDGHVGGQLLAAIDRALQSPETL